jgi:hypothetical protein
MGYERSITTPEQRRIAGFSVGIMVCFFYAFVLHLVCVALFGFISLLTRSEYLWETFLYFFRLIQLLYLVPLILLSMRHKAYNAMIGFILSAALTLELGIPIAGFGLVCSAP